ncbi:MAG: FtsX-like permease family protein [Oscillospiraceae bacterium]|jgi:putative ABC transport system permease protein|nr:FtsX-like permease family protein [Oscillospiraceae bacterium]
MKQKNYLSPLNISLKNIGRRKVRSICLTAITAFLSFVLIGGTLLSVCLKNGVNSITARLGADALFVPYGYEQSAEGALLRGEPSAFYFEGEAAATLLNADGIERATPQLFIASFDSPHCSALVQMIGYDAESDFLISPWLNGTVPGGPGLNEVVVGSKINGKVGDLLSFFSRTYTVVGKLAETGMGFDTTAFINMDMAQTALAEYAKLGGENVPEGQGVISSIAVKVQPGIDTNEFAKNIRITYWKERAAVILPKTIISGMSSNLGALLAVITILAVFLWILAAGVLALIFTLSLNERRREFGIFRVLGSSKSKLAAIILTESAVISAAGAVLGLGLVSLVYFQFERLLVSAIDLPYLRPDTGTLFAVLLGGFALALITGPLTALSSALRIGNLASASIIKEGA